MADFSQGRAGALAYQHDWQQSINTLYKREEHASRVRAEVEQKTQNYSKLLEKKNLTSPYNNARLQKFYSEHLPKIGQFITENPDFETDIGKHAQFMQMASQLQDNDIIREELQVQKERELLHQNRNELTKEEFILENERLDGYWNQDPESQEKADPYFFNNYLITDFNKVADQAAQSLAKSTYVDKEGYTVTSYTESDLQRITNDYLSNPKYAKATEKAYVDSGAKEEGFYKTPAEYFAATIRARSDRSRLPNATAMKAGSDDEDFWTTPYYNHFNRLLVNGSADGNPWHLAFTVFQEENSEVDIGTLQRSGGAKVIVNGQYKELNLPGMYQSLSGGGEIIETSAGEWMVSVPVAVLASTKSGTKDNIKLYEELGFTTSKDPGIMQSQTRDTNKTVVQGTILVPYKNNVENIHAYNKKFKTTEQLHKNPKGALIDQRISVATNKLNSLRNMARRGSPFTAKDEGVELPLSMSNSKIVEIDGMPGTFGIMSIENGRKVVMILDDYGNIIDASIE